MIMSSFVELNYTGSLFSSTPLGIDFDLDHVWLKACLIIRVGHEAGRVKVGSGTVQGPTLSGHTEGICLSYRLPTASYVPARLNDEEYLQKWSTSVHTYLYGRQGWKVLLYLGTFNNTAVPNGIRKNQQVGLNQGCATPIISRVIQGGHFSNMADGGQILFYQI